MLCEMNLSQRTSRKSTVLILVLMEYALRDGQKPSPTYYLSLNPCFNGICSARRTERREHSENVVLILVLMEYALRVSQKEKRANAHHRLNPCFNGICSASISVILTLVRITSLNPCFNGICSASWMFLATSCLLQS